MKKKFIIGLILSVCFIFVIGLVGCKNNEVESGVYEVIFLQENVELGRKTYNIGEKPKDDDYPIINSRVGYDAKWEEFDFSGVSENDIITIYAEYLPKKYIVSYETDGGTNITKTTEVTYDSPYELEVAAKPGMTFEYWLYSEGSASYKIFKTGEKWTIDKDITLTAVYSNNVYKVTYDAAGGTLSNTFTYVRFGKPYTLETPIRDNYVFDGWKDENDNNVAVGGPSWDYQNDVNLTAVWHESPKEYWTLTFIQQGKPNVVELVEKGDAFSYERAPQITTGAIGYKGTWCIGGTDGEAVNFNNITSDMTLYVDYRPKTFTITFNTNGGEAIARTSVTYGEEYELPVAVMSDRDLDSDWICGDKTILFDGVWNYDFDSEIITLTAKWFVKVTFVQDNKTPIARRYEVGTNLSESNVPPCINETDDEWYYTWKDLESYQNLQENTTVYSNKTEKYWTENK